MENFQEVIQGAIEKFASKETPETQAALKKITTEIIQDKKLPKDAMGISEAMLETIYAHAYRLYNMSKYLEASQLFRLLAMLNATQAKYILGLAACLHMQKDYKNAAAMYTICAIMEPKNPVPHFHSSDCYMKLEDLDSALIALKLTVSRTDNLPEYQKLKERSLIMIEALEEKLKEKNPKS